MSSVFPQQFLQEAISLGVNAVAQLTYPNPAAKPLPSTVRPYTLSFYHGSMVDEGAFTPACDMLFKETEALVNLRDLLNKHITTVARQDLSVTKLTALMTEGFSIQLRIDQSESVDEPGRRSKVEQASAMLFEAGWNVSRSVDVDKSEVVISGTPLGAAE